MDELPNEILPIVAGYLPPLDASRLSNASKRLHSNVSLTATRPLKILNLFVRRDCDDDAHYAFQIPVPPPHVVTSCHSVNLSLNWRDQGWGERRGRLYLVAEDRVPSPRGSGGRVVHISDFAPHEERKLHITFQPREHETYHLSYVVGSGGGGRELRLSGVSVQALVHDDPSRCFGNAHAFLADANVLRAWDEPGAIVHLDVEQLYLARGRATAPLMTFNRSKSRSKTAMEDWRELMEFMELMGHLRSLWDAWVEARASYAERSAIETGVQLAKERGFAEGVGLPDDDDVLIFDFESEDALDFMDSISREMSGRSLGGSVSA